MKDTFNFINSNAIVASLITLVITTIIQIMFRKSDRKYSENQENKKDKKNQFLNKAELRIDKNFEDNGLLETIKVLLTDFQVKIINNDVKFIYSKNIRNKQKYKHIIFYIKNIGKADIEYMDICVTSKKNLMLCGIDYVDVLSTTNLVNYNYCYDKKILKEEAIKIDIAYLENSKIASIITSELEILFRDSYGNLYAQPFFVQRENLYSPRKINEKDYREMISADDAIECFKNPLKW